MQLENKVNIYGHFGGIGVRIALSKQLPRALSAGTDMPKTMRTLTVLVDWETWANTVKRKI